MNYTLEQQLKILEDEVASAIEFAKQVDPQTRLQIKQLKQELEQLRNRNP